MGSRLIVFIIITATKSGKCFCASIHVHDENGEREWPNQSNNRKNRIFFLEVIPKILIINHRLSPLIQQDRMSSVLFVFGSLVYIHVVYTGANASHEFVKLHLQMHIILSFKIVKLL